MNINEKTHNAKNCIFYLLNTDSHYNSTYKIACELKKRGYNPVYVGDSNMRRSVEANGFDFFEYSIRLFCINKGILKKSSLTVREVEADYLDNYEKCFLKGGYFDEVIHRFNPIIVFLDISKIGFSPDLLKNHIKLAILSTKVNLNKEPYIPPFISSFIPYKRNLLTKMICELLWFQVLFIKKLDNLVTKARKKDLNLYELPFKYLRANKLYNFKKLINYKRVTNFGLKKIPEIILSPQEFDYPNRKVNNNQIYIGPSVYMERNETIPREVEKFLYRENLIYCSMGLYDSKYQHIRVKFINKIIQAFSSNFEFSIIISTGRDIIINEKVELPDNILIHQNVPQLEVLRHSNIMISHGGMQSITESIINNVPLIIYALNPKLDQIGNAARVKYHNIGIIGNIRKDTPKDIFEKVRQLMSNNEILKCTGELGDKFINSKNFRNGIKNIEDYINKQSIVQP